ncbi:hypothetical protein AYI69_g10248 [Smittium culicis]|uniref:Uncharacterized protein n=1 Tax=Smittium culicis TaxID=133412 RepID=A0A1R1X712_9FUNG|nr:hypothetical protein AYI69_g10248 [Smittium culicis]
MLIFPKPSIPPDKQTKSVSFSDPLATDIKFNFDSDPPDILFVSQISFHDMPTGKLTSTPLTTMTLHLNESIFFKLTATLTTVLFRF